MVIEQTRLVYIRLKTATENIFEVRCSSLLRVHRSPPPPPQFPLSRPTLQLFSRHLTVRLKQARAIAP